jgi:hypothetical protein
MVSYAANQPSLFVIDHVSCRSVSSLLGGDMYDCEVLMFVKTLGYARVGQLFNRQIMFNM